MFDVGFSELVLTGVVALVVLGPERLPKVARTAGMWAGRARKFLSNVKADIDREMKAEELRQIVEKQAKSTGVHEIVEQTRSTVNEIKAGTAAAAAPVAEATQKADEAVRAAALAAPSATVPAASPATAQAAPAGDKPPQP
jgi:sec-independent protein translocase protein TatB